MGPDAMILVFWMLSFKPTFSLSSFIRRLFSSSLSAIRVVSSEHLRLLIFLLAILIPACASSKANRILPREITDHSKYPLPTTQETILHMDITRWSILKSDWLYSLKLKMEKLYTVSKNKTRIWLWLRSWTPYCQIQTEIEESGETTRPFMYDLNKIPYDYTVEVRNRFKGLDLIECLMNYGWRFMTLYRRQRSRQSPGKRNAKRQNGCLRRHYK